MADKIYAPKPAKGDIEKELDKLPKDQHGAYKAGVLAKVKLPKTFTLDGVTVTITAGPRLHENGKWVEVELTAERGGVALRVDNPYQFENPPVMHHDGTWRQEISAIHNSVVDVPNMAERPAETLQRIIVDAVLRAVQ